MKKKFPIIAKIKAKGLLPIETLRASGRHPSLLGYLARISFGVCCIPLNLNEDLREDVRGVLVFQQGPEFSGNG